MEAEKEFADNADRKDFEIRRELWDRLQADPDGYESNRDFGVYCASRRNLVVHAIPYLQKALAFGRGDDKDDQDMLTSLGESLKLVGDLDGAREAYGELLRRFPDIISYRFLAGDIDHYEGRIEQASAVYGVAVALLSGNAQMLVERTGEADARALSPGRVLCAHIGEIAHKLDLFVKARALGLIEDFEAVVIAPDDEIANRALMDCYREHVTVISDPAEVDAAMTKYKSRRFFVDYLTVRPGLTLNREHAYGVVQRMWSDHGHPPPIRIPDEMIERGRKVLAGLGMPKDAWFAALHVRESGFFEEDHPWSHNRLRNADVMDYLPAIKTIVERGGWVLRMGDPSMTPLPEMERVIDYANSEVRSDWMDIFGLSQCRFFIGTASGPMNVARAFCVPVLATNYFPTGTWPFSAGDLFIHKLHKWQENGRWLTLREAMTPPVCASWNPMVYERHGIEVVDNTPEEITAATADMLDLLDGTANPDREAGFKRRLYRQIADPNGLGLLLPVAPSFLAAHPHLLD